MSTWIDGVEESIPNEPSSDEQSADSISNGAPDSQIAEVSSAHMEKSSNEPVIAEAPAPTKSIDERELQAILETLLFVSHEPVTVDRLVAVLGGVAEAEIRQT